MTGLLFSLSTSNAAAQTFVLTGHDTIRITAKQGTTSLPDTLVFEQGRLGGRYFIYFRRGQDKWFKIDPSLKNRFNGHKLKAHEILRVPIVFCPPAGFTGEAHTVFYIEGFSGPWISAEIVGISMD